MKRIFEIIHPDYGGYTFFSVVVWEDVLDLAHESTHIGWQIPIRILEARFVIQGRILYHIVEAYTSEMLDKEKEYDEAIKVSQHLTEKWMMEFGNIKQFTWKGSIFKDINYCLLVRKMIGLWIRRYRRKA